MGVVSQELEACREELETERKQAVSRTPRKTSHTLKKKRQESKWMEVMTDLLLSLLSQSSQLWRTTTEQVGKGSPIAQGHL